MVIHSIQGGTEEETHNTRPALTFNNAVYTENQQYIYPNTVRDKPRDQRTNRTSNANHHVTLKYSISLAGNDTEGLLMHVLPNLAMNCASIISNDARVIKEELACALLAVNSERPLWLRLGNFIPVLVETLIDAATGLSHIACTTR